MASMSRVKRVRRSAVVLMLTSSLLAPNCGAATAQETSYVPPLMHACRTPADTECVEGLALTNDQGVRREASLTGGTFLTPWLPPGEAYEVWSVQFDGQPAIDLFIDAWHRPDGAALCWVGSESCSYHSGSLDTDIRSTQGDFKATYRFELRLRALRFVPGAVGGKGEQVQFRTLSSDVATGSRTIEVSGTNIHFDTYNLTADNPTPPGQREHADGTADFPVFWIWDQYNDALGRIPGTCRMNATSSEIPHLMFSAFNMGNPEWDPSTRTVSVTLESAHLAFDGTPNPGYYEIFLPTKVAKCMWGLDLTRAVKATVSIADAGTGDAQPAVFTQQTTDLGFTIIASNFHYSTPRISVRLDQAPVATWPKVDQAPTSKVSKAKLRVITCRRAGVSKKVRAVTPKCPNGWKPSA